MYVCMFYHHEEIVMYTDGKWRLHCIVYYSTNAYEVIVSDLGLIYRWLTDKKREEGSKPNNFFQCEDELLS